MDLDKKSITIEEGIEEKKKSRMSVIFDGKSQSRSLNLSTGTATSRMRVRKQSFGFSTVSGIKNADKSAQFGQEFKRPILNYLNTYQVDPYVRFNPVQVTKAIETLLDKSFTNHKYNVQTSPELALQLAGELLRTVKIMKFNRYRILSVVTIAQKRAQSYVNAVAFLWDHQRDNFVNVQREEHTCFIQVTVFGVYLD